MSCPSATNHTYAPSHGADASQKLAEELQRLSRKDLLKAAPLAHSYQLTDNKRPRPIKGWTKPDHQALLFRTAIKRSSFSTSELAAVALVLSFSLSSIGVGIINQLTHSQSSSRVQHDTASPAIANSAPPTYSSQHSAVRKRQTNGTRLNLIGSAGQPAQQSLWLPAGKPGDLSPSEAQAAARLVHEANQLLQTGQARAAGNLLQKSLYRFGNVFEVNLLLARCYLSERELAEALRLCGQSVHCAQSEKDLNALADVIAAIEKELDHKRGNKPASEPMAAQPSTPPTVASQLDTKFSSVAAAAMAAAVRQSISTSSSERRSVAASQKPLLTAEADTATFMTAPPAQYVQTYEWRTSR